MRKSFQAPLSAMVLAIFGVQVALPIRARAAADLAACVGAESICAGVRASSQAPTDALMNSVCAVPSPLPSNTTVEEIETAVNDCRSTLRAKWGQLSPSCDVMDFSDKNKGDATGLSIAYGVAAAACAVSCACELANGCAGAYIGFLAACTGAALSVGGTDMGVSLARKEEAKQNTDVYNDIIGPSLSLVGGASTGLALGVSGGTGGFAANSGTRATSCLTALMMAAQAIYKGYSASTSDETKASACQLVMDEAGPSITLQGNAQIAGDTSAGNQLPAGSGSGSGTSTSAASTSSASQGGKGGGNLLKDPAAFAAVVAAASAEDPVLGEFYRKMPPKDALKALNDLGPGAIQAALGGGAGSMSAMMKPIMDGLSAKGGDMAKAGDKIGKNLAATDAEFKKRLQEYQKKALAGTAYQKAGGAGGGKAGDSAKPFTFGFMGGGSGATGPSEVNFTGTTDGAAKVAQPVEVESDDIYHAEFKGSIFQIVSKKLGRTGDRVEQYEWELPLNRARQNLPWKPSGEGLRKPASAPKQ